MGKKRKEDFSADELSEVNVTPLADVSLTLVIMMMVMAPMVFQSLMQVKPAQAVATKKNERVVEKPIFVDITKKGFTVNNNKIETEYALFRTLQNNLARKKDRTVLVSSESDVKYELVVRVLDIVKQSGASSLALVPRRKAAS